MRFTVILFLFAGTAFGQSFSIGIKGGVPLTGNFLTGSGAGDRAFSISPYLNSPNFGSGANEVEVLLGIEVDRR